MIKKEYKTQAGRPEAPTARSPVAGTVELVKPLHAEWPSSDEPRAKAMSRKTEKRLPKEMAGRRLSQDEAKRLLAKFE